MLIKMLIEARDRRSRLCNSNTGSACGSHVTASTNGGKSQAERTTAMLVIIVFVFLVTELPQASFNVQLIVIVLKFREFWSLQPESSQLFVLPCRIWAISSIYSPYLTLPSTSFFIPPCPFFFAKNSSRRSDSAFRNLSNNGIQSESSSPTVLLFVE